jgi:F-type H+-transporting ATPase subunit b
MEIDWWTFAAQIINLIILLFLLRRFLYIPVLKAVSARQKLIADELKKAESARQEAQKITAECERRLAQIEVQKQEILKQTNITAEQFAANLRQEAEAQYKSAVANWQNKVIGEKQAFTLAMQNLIAEYFARFADSALTQMADVHLNDLVLAKFMEKLQQQTKVLPALFAEQKNFIIHTAQPLNDDNVRQIKKFLQEKAAVSNAAEFVVKINPVLICGVAIEAGGQQISWHLADYMQQFQQSLQNEMMQLLKRS